jgi:hypothetical protein
VVVLDTIAVLLRRETIHRETVWALELPPRDPDESGFALAQLTISGAPGTRDDAAPLGACSRFSTYRATRRSSID